MSVPVDYRALSRGDAVPLSGPPAIFLPGPSRWYALRVAPQREDQAEDWLDRRGVYGFHPVLKVARTRHGKPRLYQRRYVPGYVFARFRGAPVVHEVLSCPWITGALARSDGEWGVLDGARLRALHAMRALDREVEELRNADRIRRMVAARPVLGERALFRVGPFAGVSGEVVELRAEGGVMIRLTLFGGEILAEARATDLVRLHPAA